MHPYHRYFGAATLTSRAVLADGVILTGSRNIYAIIFQYPGTVLGTDVGTYTVTTADGSKTLFSGIVGTNTTSFLQLDVFKGQFYAPEGISIQFDTTVTGNPDDTFFVTVFHSHQGA